MSASLVPVGPSVPQAIAAVLESHQSAIRQLQNPDRPMPAYALATADLPDAADWPNCVVLVSDIPILAVSDGSDWIRQDTGAPV